MQYKMTSVYKVGVNKTNGKKSLKEHVIAADKTVNEDLVK